MLLVTEKLPRFIEEELLPDFCPRIVYHYTTIDVLGEFFKDDGDLYCTHCRALNDDEEFRVGLEYARYIISRSYYVSSRAMSGFVDRCLKLRHDKWRQPWIMSFTTEADSLSQWISYCDKRNGGYAIGFDYRALRRCVVEKMRSSSQSFNIYLMPCLYIAHQRAYRAMGQKDIADRLLEFLLDPFIDEIQMFAKGKQTGENSNMESAILLFASMIKNASFSHEHECRLVIQPTNKDSALKNYRIVGHKPRLPSLMFTKRNPLRSMIKSVGVSPHGNQNVLCATAELYGDMFNNRFHVYRSASPYNGM